MIDFVDNVDVSDASNYQKNERNDQISFKKVGYPAKPYIRTSCSILLMIFSLRLVRRTTGKDSAPILPEIGNVLGKPPC